MKSVVARTRIYGVAIMDHELSRILSLLIMPPLVDGRLEICRTINVATQ